MAQLEDYIDFEVYDIENLAVWDKSTIIKIRVFGLIGGKDIDFDNDIYAPQSINTYNEVSDFLMNLLQKYYDTAEIRTDEELLKSRWKMNLGGI